MDVIPPETEWAVRANFTIYSDLEKRSPAHKGVLCTPCKQVSSLGEVVMQNSVTRNNSCIVLVLSSLSFILDPLVLVRELALFGMIQTKIFVPGGGWFHHWSLILVMSHSMNHQPLKDWVVPEERQGKKLWLCTPTKLTPTHELFEGETCTCCITFFYIMCCISSDFQLLTDCWARVHGINYPNFLVANQSPDWNLLGNQIIIVCFNNHQQGLMDKIYCWVCNLLCKFLASFFLLWWSSLATSYYEFWLWYWYYCTSRSRTRSPWTFS